MKKYGKLAKGVASVMAFAMAFCVVFSNGLTTQAATESKEIFSGGTNESYESNDASWLMNADNSDVIKIVYTCTDDTHAGWGVLGWGATVDDVWKDGPGLSASESDATAKVTAKVTAGDLKKTLGIKDGSNVSFIKLGAWNGGKIVSLSISGAGAASSSSSASSDAAASEEVVIQAPPELTGDYLYLLDKVDTVTIWPDLYLPYWVPGQTIHLKVEMESNGSFGGCLGTCVNKWAWQMETFSSDTGSTITVDWFLTPLSNNIQLQFWWMSGTQIGIKSIEVVKAIHPNPPAEGETPAVGGPVAVPGVSYTFSDGSWWTQKAVSMSDFLGSVDPATVSSVTFSCPTSFTIGYNTVNGWAQFADQTSYTITDLDLSPDNYALSFGLSKADDVPYTISWTFNAAADTPSDDTTESTAVTTSYTFDMNENGNLETYVFDLHEKVSGLQVGDEVKATVKLSSSGGWFGGAFGYNGADASWTQTQVDAIGTEYTFTIPVIYESGNNVQLQQWWIGGANVTADITLEKITN